MKRICHEQQAFNEQAGADICAWFFNEAPGIG
jgi:hypothetical protein